MIALDRVAERISRGEPLSEADAQAILETRDLIRIGTLGDEVRRRMHGRRTTFGRVFEIHVDAVPERLPSGMHAGELRIIGKPASVEAAVEAVRTAAVSSGNTPLLGFSLPDLRALAGSGEGFVEVCRALREAGLAGIAEVPLDRPEDAAGVVQAARKAGLRIERLTVDTLADEDRGGIVAGARALQNAVGGFRAFAPLARMIPPTLPTTGYDDVKQVALARMVVTNIPSIQVDWQLYGPKLAQVALTMGADDIDRVDAMEDGALGVRRSARAEILANIRAAALDPVERDGLFQVKD